MLLVANLKINLQFEAGLIQLKPCEGRHFPITFSRQLTGCLSAFVPSSSFPDDTPIGIKIPRKIRKMINITFIVVSQNSISPYLLTLKRLKKIGMMRKIAIEAYGGIDVVQKEMKCDAARALLG
jgi:hypothetical protein